MDKIPPNPVTSSAQAKNLPPKKRPRSKTQNKYDLIKAKQRKPTTNSSASSSSSSGPQHPRKKNKIALLNFNSNSEDEINYIQYLGKPSYNKEGLIINRKQLPDWLSLVGYYLLANHR